MEIGLICSQCRNSMFEVDSTFFCEKCHHKYYQENDVLRTSNLGSYWQIIDSNLMEKLLLDARLIGWKNAILNSDNQTIQELYFWTDCESRADATYYLPLDKNSIVLDLGSGWGSYTFPLSRRVKKVFAIDSCLESLEFIAVRSQQDNIGNIFPIHIKPLDYGILPFDNNQFDSVIMNGVLEWVGSYIQKGDPTKIQLNCLKEINRVLKPNGTILIGIENRFGFKYFLGSPDEHLRYYTKTRTIRYTTLLPRFISNMITKRLISVPYRTYTHSICKYKKMLNNANFHKVKFLYPEDGYRAKSTKIFHLNTNNFKKSIMKKYGSNIFFKILHYVGLDYFFSDSFFIIGEKNDPAD